MKLGLLLALTGAALVLNLSESRIVSKCELRQKLQQVLPLPRKYGRYKDQILALVTCELERRSQLDSNLVTGDAVLPTAAARQTTQASEGNQTATEQDIDSTISSAPMISTTVPSLRRKRWASKKDFRDRSDKRRGRKGQSSEESGESDSSSEESHEMENHGANKPTVSSRTPEMSDGVSDNPRQKRDASSEEKGHKQRGHKKRGDKKRGKKGQSSEESDETSEQSHEMENHGANKPTASSSTTEMSDGVSGNPRQKRDASSEEKGHKQRGNKKRGDKKRGKKGRGSEESEESGSSSHEMENHGDSKPTASSGTTEMSDGVSGNPRVKRDASSEERGNRRRGDKKRGDKKQGNKGRGSDESNESGKNKQKNKKEKKPSKHSHESSSQEEYTMEQNQGPSNYFGLFQLSDSFFCDSGNGLSKNLCDKNCSAFVDDDITDDLECFAYRGYWRSILDEVSSSCSDQQDTYFDECE